MDALERAVALDPSRGESWNNLGNLYKEQGRLADALDAYDRALDLNPSGVVVPADLPDRVRGAGAAPEQARAPLRQRRRRQGGHGQVVAGHGEPPGDRLGDAVSVAVFPDKPGRLHVLAGDVVAAGHGQVDGIVVGALGVAGGPRGSVAGTLLDLVLDPLDRAWIVDRAGKLLACASKTGEPCPEGLQLTEFQSADWALQALMRLVHPEGIVASAPVLREGELVGAFYLDYSHDEVVGDAPPLQLGLDLKGGVHLVLRVQTDDALRLLTEGTADQLAERIAQNAPMSNFAVMHALPRIADQTQSEGLFTESLMAALLHDVVEDTPTTLEEIRGQFGGEVGLLVDGLTKVDDKLLSREALKEQTYRKQLLLAVRDIRVLCLKFWDRIDNLQTIGALNPRKQSLIAEETRTIYVPLAQHLGMGRVAIDLDALSLNILYPTRARRYRAAVGEVRNRHEAMLGRVRSEIHNILEHHRINATVVDRWRPFSIAAARTTARGLSSLYTLDIMVDRTMDAYLALGLLRKYPKLRAHFEARFVG